MRKCKLLVLFLLCVFVLSSCSQAKLPNGLPKITDSPNANTKGYGTKLKGDILFNNLEWGTSRDEVYKTLKELFSTVEIIESVHTDDYGEVKQIVCTYKNASYYSPIGEVGDMEIDEIKVWYITMDDKYSNSMFKAQYTSDNYYPYDSMVEMLVHKYGEPYAHYEEKSRSDIVTIDMNNYVWSNENYSQKLSINKTNNLYNHGAATGLPLGSSKDQSLVIEYRDVFIDNYVRQQREKYEEQKKNDEISNKNYNGL